MSKNPDRPAVFLAFADTAIEESPPQMKKESTLLQDLFMPLHQRGEIELLQEKSVDAEELPKLLHGYKSRIRIFHFKEQGVRMDPAVEENTGNTEGLTSLLAQQSGLQLVFLNGCSTQALARAFMRTEVPIVIVTTESISDEEATLFTEYFYKALLNRHTVREAFRSAGNGVGEIIPCQGGDLLENDLTEAPWKLYVQKNKEGALDWKLSQALDTPGKGTNNERLLSYKKWLWGWVVTTGVVLSLLASITELTGVNLSGLFTSPKADSFSVTVLVHGKQGKDDRILRGQGKVTMDFGATREEASINEKGEATFKELPAWYIGKEALLSIDHPQPYFPVKRGQKYNLKRGQAIYLAVELKGMDKIRGRVIDGETELPLKSVRVSYQDIATHTDEFGWFELVIPSDKQAKFIRVNFYKEGYKMEEVDSIAPHIQQEIGISLKRR